MMAFRIYHRTVRRARVDAQTCRNFGSDYYRGILEVNYIVTKIRCHIVRHTTARRPYIVRLIRVAIRLVSFDLSIGKPAAHHRLP